MSVSVAYCMAK